jgi:hypothetical protein
MEPPVGVKYPEHDRTCFFKYTSASTAVKILESSAVLYRSPRQFNDPFDVQSGLHFDFDINSLPDKILDHIERLVSLDTKPDVPTTEPFGELVTRMWKMKETCGFFPKEGLREVARPVLVQLAEQVVYFQQQYQQVWWNDFLPRRRSPVPGKDVDGELDPTPGIREQPGSDSAVLRRP